MNRVTVVMILALFLTMKAATGQGPPLHCHCYLATNPGHDPGCDTRGCSAGTNPYCNDGDYLPSRYYCSFVYGTPDDPDFPFAVYGCNCPDSPFNLGFNGRYEGPPFFIPDFFNYTTCTGFGSPHSNDYSAPTDCCNFCCGRNDPYPTSTTTTTAATTTTGLPPECYNPDGSSCDWYKGCLEKKYPCQGDPDDYAIKYAMKYCNLYTENYNKFSAAGQKWVDAVRKCLQRKLVPLISPTSTNVTCKQIKEEAFASHTPCYIDPNPDAPVISFCYLEFDDLLEIFDTIKSAFTEELIASIEGFISTMYGCVRQRSANVYHLLRMSVSIRNNTLVNRVSEPFREDDELAKLIADGIAKIESWDPKRVGYFPYSANTSVVRTKVHEQQIIVEMLLADQFVWDNLDNTSIANTTHSYLNHTIDHLAQSVQQGKLEIKTANGTFYVTHMDKCLNISCNETGENPAVASPYNFAICLVNSNIFLIIVLLYILLLKN